MVEQSATADRAKEQVQQTAQVTQEKMQETAQTARTRVREQVDQRSTEAASQVRSTAQALRSTSEKLREEGRDGPARAADRAAEQAEKVGGYLERADSDRILRDVEDFGRRQPLAVAGIGLALGFAASRFLKASSRSRYEQGSGHEARQGEQTTVYPGMAGGDEATTGHGIGPVVPTAGANGLS